MVVDVPVTREDAIPFSGSSSYYAAVAAMGLAAVSEITAAAMDAATDADTILSGSCCSYAAVAATTAAFADPS